MNFLITPLELHEYEQSFKGGAIDEAFSPAG